MKNHNKVFWAIILILGAAGLILGVTFPDIALLQIPVWKWVLSALLLYWLIKNLVWGERLADHFDIFLPLALAFCLFGPELVGEKFGWNLAWKVVLAAVLLTIAVHLLFDRRRAVHVSSDSGFSSADEINGPQSNTFGSKVVYLDATKSDHSVYNKFGSMAVHFQNTDVAEGPQEISLHADNSFGQLIITVPEGWIVNKNISKFAGEVDIKDRSVVSGSRILNITGECNFGQTIIQ